MLAQQGEKEKGEDGEGESVISSLLQAAHLADDSALNAVVGAGGLTDEVAAQLRLQIEERLQAAADGGFYAPSHSYAVLPFLPLFMRVLPQCRYQFAAPYTYSVMLFQAQFRWRKAVKRQRRQGERCGLALKLSQQGWPRSWLSSCGLSWNPRWLAGWQASTAQESDSTCGASLPSLPATSGRIRSGCGVLDQISANTRFALQSFSYYNQEIINKWTSHHIDTMSIQRNNIATPGAHK